MSLQLVLHFFVIFAIILQLYRNIFLTTYLDGLEVDVKSLRNKRIQDGQILSDLDTLKATRRVIFKIIYTICKRLNVKNYIT